MCECVANVHSDLRACKMTSEIYWTVLEMMVFLQIVSNLEPGNNSWIDRRLSMFPNSVFG